MDAARLAAGESALLRRVLDANYRLGRAETLASLAEREELRFRNSYPLVWRQLESNYRRVPTPTLEANHLLLRRRE